MLKLASRTGHVGRGKEGEREIPDVWFVFFFERIISCYNEPEVQDFIETETADRIWLNLNLQGK